MFRLGALSSKAWLGKCHQPKWQHSASKDLRMPSSSSTGTPGTSLSASPPASPSPATSTAYQSRPKGAPQGRELQHSPPSLTGSPPPSPFTTNGPQPLLTPLPRLGSLINSAHTEFLLFKASWNKGRERIEPQQNPGDRRSHKVTDSGVVCQLQ